MTNFSERMDFEIFKQELLFDRFLCKSNKPMTQDYRFDYLNLPTNDTIKNSFVYRLAENMINENKQYFSCNLIDIFNGKVELSVFKRNFIQSLYKEAMKRKLGERFLLSFQTVFDIISTYEKSKLIDMYTVDDFKSLSKTINQSSDTNSSVAYRFIWDKIGYSFGKIQVNIGAVIQNKNNVNTNRINFLKGIGFSEKDIKLLTVIPAEYTKDELARSQTRKILNEKVNHLNKRLYDSRDSIDKFCSTELNERINIINKYDVTNQLVYENEIAYIQLIDYDNQLRFNNGGTLYKYLKNKINNKDLILRGQEIVDLKLTLKYGKEAPADIKRRSNNILKHIKPVLKNAKLSDVIKVVTPEIMFDIIAINEIDLVTKNVSIYETTSKIIAALLSINSKNIIENKVINIVEDKTEVGDTNSVDEAINLINEKLGIDSEIFNSSNTNAYNIKDIGSVSSILFSDFVKKYKNTSSPLGNKIKELYPKFNDLYFNNNSLMTNLDHCHKVLLEIKTELETAEQETKDKKEITTETKEAMVVSGYFYGLCKAYGDMKNNEFAKTNLLATGIISKANAFLFSDESAMQVFADSFMSTKPKINIEQEETFINPLSVFFKKSDFLYMKELDYRNLEACLRQSHYINPSSLGCQRTWILVYIILCLLSKKETISQEDTVNKNDFINHSSKLLNEMKNKKWKYEYGDNEKLFSNMFSFVKYRDNPFTTMMNDKGFNESQKISKELRLYVEEQMKTMIDSLKEFVYGENKIYDIFQGFADIAYELSTPMTFYTDFNVFDAGESIVSQFLNACISSLEMQTAMSIYEFLFNFKINIDGKEYTLNDLNNTLKMFNMIVEISKENRFDSQLRDRTKICRQTSDYLAFKKIGFYTYNKKWNNNYDGMEEHIKDFSGFYLSDEPMLYDIVEYCRKKSIECDPGDLNELIKRFDKLEEYEWIAAFACSKSRTTNQGLSTELGNSLLLEHDIGYVQIQNFVKKLEEEAKNTNPEITFLTPFLEELGNEIMRDPTEFDKFVDYNKDMFRRFRYNMVSNEKKCIAIINSNLSDNKIYDWMMKMLPTYEMIAKAFGFASLSGLSTLETFMSSMMNSLNAIIKVTFDKWKTETAEAIEMRRIQFLEKERYYYIQSIPIIIDWTIKNLEHYILACNLVSKSDGIDITQSFENSETIDQIARGFIIKLKEEVSIMSSLQIKEFYKQLNDSILSIENIDKEKAISLINEIVGIDDIKEYTDKLLDFDLSWLTKEQKEEMVNNLEKNIDITTGSTSLDTPD